MFCPYWQKTEEGADLPLHMNFLHLINFEESETSIQANMLGEAANPSHG